MVAEMLKLIIIDVVFVGLILVALLPLSNYKRAAFAVLKRNFVGYFSNPTGYVFLCLFVLLTSIAAFWPHEFFTANLANLDQLNSYLPIVMLVFIPAITMSIWAEERRQGTDELLLTLPAGDFDIVIGKYLAAAAIFTASLLFSQLANYAVLVSLTLGDLDAGLIITTYFGYWLTGLAMIAIGMVASFLTRNLTVGFILGVAFNAPLVFAAYADAIIPSSVWARRIAELSVAAQFEDLGRGVISLSSIVYFGMVVAVGLYLSMVLIGARHWSGGRDGESMLGHYLVRIVALIAFAIGVNVLVTNRLDWVRKDLTRGGVASLSSDTIKIIRDIPADRTVRIDAYLSAQVPEPYVKTKYDLISLLKEFRARSGGNVVVNIHDGLEPFSEEVAQAEDRFGIRPEMVRTRSRGAFKDEEIILGAAFTSGLEKVVVPFFDYGVPVEYELIRSINTVAQTKRKTLGVVTTDARVFGGFTFAGGQPQQMPKQLIIEELEKQYDVEQVDANNEIDVSKFDVLLAVQPSSLSPPELNNLIAAIENGAPTAIFEDPQPTMIAAPGTGDPKQSPMGMFGGGGAPPPKGDIQRLWSVLGINPQGRRGGLQGTFQPDIVSQPYNPYPKIQVRDMGPEFVFVAVDDPNAEEPFNNEDEITSGLSEVLFPFAGSIKRAVDSSHEFTDLVSTGAMSDQVPLEEIREQMRGAQRYGIIRQNGPYILAARIKAASASENVNMSDAGYEVAQADVGTSANDAAADEPDNSEDGVESGGASAGETPQNRPLHVVYVADADCLSTPFIRIRARPDDEIGWRFQNVTFVLNIIDSLAGDSNYINIRKRETSHSTLKMVERQIKNARDKENEEREDFDNEYEKKRKELEGEKEQATEKLQKILNSLQNPEEGVTVTQQELQEAARNFAIREQIAQRRFDIANERLERERDRKIEKIRREMDLEILKVQNEYKFWAVAIPPIPPLLVGMVVFVRRRLREREGVSRSRLR